MTAQTRQVALTDVTGPGTEYLRDLGSVATGDVTYGDKAELLDVQYAETTRQAGVLTKAAIAIASGGNAWLSFGLNTVADAAISGEVNLDNIAKDAAFTAIGGGFEVGDVSFAGTDALVSDWVGGFDLVNTGYFSPNKLATIGAQGVLNGSTQTAFYGGNLGDNIGNSLSNSVVNEALALTQSQIRGLKSGEGSLDGAFLHGLAGCAASAAKDGGCAEGFVAAAGAEFATGALHRQNGGDTIATAETMQRYGNPIIAALTSGGDVNQFGVNRGIADSKLNHNYLNKAQRDEVEKLLRDLKFCADGDMQCYREQDDINRQLRLLRDVSNAQTRAMIDVCSQGPSNACQAHIDASEGFVDWSLYSPYNEAFRYLGQTPSTFRAQTGVMDGVENQFDLDSIAREYMVAIQSGEMTPDEAGLAMARDLQKQDGRLKIIGGAVELAGAGACAITKLTCVLGLMSAGIGADRVYEGTATAISGEDQLSMIEGIAEAAGVKDPEALRDDIETGVAIVTVGAGGGMLVYKGGKVVANLGKHTDEVVVLKATKGVVAAIPEAPPAPTGNFNTIYPRGPGAADGPLPDGYTYVSRWVSPKEARMWLDNQGTAIPSAAGHVPGATTPRVFVTQQFDGKPPGATGSIRIDFAAPAAMMKSGTGSSTGLDRVIFQPATSTPIYNVRIHIPDSAKTSN